MSTVYYYRVYCSPTGTTAAGEYHYLWDTEAPSTCPVGNSNHILDDASITVLNQVSETTVQLKEEHIPTGGFSQFSSRVCEITAATGSLQIFDFSFEIPINLNAVAITINEDHIGDCFDVYVAPNTTVGVLGANGTTGTNVLTVSQTVIDNVNIGFFINITDLVNNDNLGRVIAIDKVNNTVTVKNNLSYNFSALSPTYVQMSIKLVDSLKVTHPTTLQLGDERASTSYMPVGTIVRVAYVNSTGVAKKLGIIGKYIY